MLGRVTARLRLLDGVRWCGEPVPGERLGALLAALALRPAGVADDSLVDLVWDDDTPASPVKALQVLVSRVRAGRDPQLVVRYDGGYRLGLEPEDVDALWLARAVELARSRLAAGDADAVLALLDEVEKVTVEPVDEPAALAELRREAQRELAAADRLRGLALSRVGRHAEAAPLLGAARGEARDDSEVLLALLRSEAVAVGPAAALDRYERYRSDLAERLGVDPAPELQRLHRELLAADHPVRSGLRFDADALLGRADDLARIRASLEVGRLTTVLGPGGIGKTSAAQVIARESTLPRVDVVELVGVTSGDDVVAEVGAALGVRGSVTSRRTLTPAQRADVRGRIAQELDSGPALLVLDNCEHVLEPVAALVAFLLATTRDLRVLATSRAPLRIAAERVVPLTQLDAVVSAELFRRRALAVRPEADLDDDTVSAIVARLDGLPLAIELAAARVRTMSVQEVRRALDDRFTLLRSRDRARPDRHRTLSAVIEWSWDLLGTDEQRALAWLSVFHDGFSAEAARALVGAAAEDLVESLVEHSLLVVSEAHGAARFRALETIREFAALRLDRSGERAQALAAQDAWAAALAGRHADLFAARDQIERVSQLQAEENNLTDVLRRALVRADATLVARLLGTLGQHWVITGNQPRVFSIADAAEEVLLDWDPPEAVRAAAIDAASILLVHSSWIPHRSIEPLRELLVTWGQPPSPWAQAAHVMLVEQSDLPGAHRLAAAAAAEADPVTAGMLLLWAALMADNDGDAPTAIEHARRGLTLGELTPFVEASLHGELSQLLMVTGDHHEAARHAELSWPVLARLHADDDAHSLRVATALAPLIDGDLDECERILDSVEVSTDGGQFGSHMVTLAARAELALARGDLEGGLDLFDTAVEEMRLSEFPGLGFSPWLLLASAGALVARVRHAAADDARARELARMLYDGTVDPTTGGFLLRDLPLNGVLVVALGAWVLRAGDEAAYDDGVRLLALAERWGYNRSFPTMAWPRVAPLAERVRPGLLDALMKEYAERPSLELLTEGEAALARIAPAITSSG